MVSPSRSSTSRRRRDDAGKLVVGVLILLGLIASVFLIFSTSLQLVRVGLVAALWAAAVGALMATRYRRDAAIDQAKARDLQTVYELQLEREINARREYELGVEAQVRKEVGADAAELAALRAELSVLRESLQRLFDGGLQRDRPALHADAIRIQELPGAMSANGNSAETDHWDAWSAPTVPRYVFTPVFDPDTPEPPAFATPYDDPVTAETAVLPVDRTDTDLDLGAADWSAVRFDPFRASEPEPELEPELQPEPEPEPDWEPRATEPVDGERTPETAPEPTGSAGTGGEAPPPDRTAERMGTAGRRRRRADDDGDDPSGRKLSVAEIMANLRSEQNG
jgi:hypothetical protein